MNRVIVTMLLIFILYALSLAFSFFHVLIEIMDHTARKGFQMKGFLEILPVLAGATIENLMNLGIKEGAMLMMTMEKLEILEEKTIHTRIQTTMMWIDFMQVVVAGMVIVIWMTSTIMDLIGCLDIVNEEMLDFPMIIMSI